MHRSQLGGIIIDCRTEDLERAAAFWAAALGRQALADPRSDTSRYRRLDTRPREKQIEVQKVDHESRVHLDIESDDIEAEVARLEGLGARRAETLPGWVVMEAPTGQRFCVVRPGSDDFDREANRWE